MHSLAVALRPKQYPRVSDQYIYLAAALMEADRLVLSPKSTASIPLIGQNDISRHLKKYSEELQLNNHKS